MNLEPRKLTSFVLISLAASLGLGAGACFNGLQAEGLPCTADSHCGPQLECIDGFCGGVFACDDGSKIEASLVCDGNDDCVDGSDETPSACGVADEAGTETGDDELIDQCSDDEQPLQLGQGPSTAAPNAPMGVLAGQFAGSPHVDLLVASRGGNQVRVLDLQGPDTWVTYDLPGDQETSPQFLTNVEFVLTRDFEGDGDDDIVVLTEDARAFPYLSEDNSNPVLLGEPFDPPFEVDVSAAALGSISDDNWTDLVGVTSGGLVFSAEGDPGSDSVFVLELSAHVIPGSGWEAAKLSNLDGQGPDELLVLGRNEAQQPTLFIIARDPELVDDGWEPLGQYAVGFAAEELAVGQLDATPGLDVVVLDPNGRLAILSQADPMSFELAATLDGLGGGTTGLTVHDLDCDQRDDVLFNVDSDQGIRVLFGDGEGGFDASKELTLSAAGRPMGAIAVVQFDVDLSWDIFHTADMGTNLATPMVFGYLSDAPAPRGP